MQADLRLCCSLATKSGVFLRRGSNFCLPCAIIDHYLLQSTATYSVRNFMESETRPIALRLKQWQYYDIICGPPRGFGEQGKTDIYFKRTGDKRPNFDRNR